MYYNVLICIRTERVRVMEISFLPGIISSLTLSVLMPSVLTNYVHVLVRISVQVLVEAHAVGLLLGSIIVSLTL